jgi:hypothetical protein
VKGIKTRTSKNKGRESKNQGTTGSMRDAKMMARFRCGNEERENKYWMEGGERRCRMCHEEKDNRAQIREREGKEWGEILNEDRREIRGMKEIWKRRDERIEKERGGV